MQLTDVPTAEDLRAMRARRQEQLYVLAAKARIHPSRLGQYLNGSLPLPPEVASRIAAALSDDTKAS